jgi:beta-1,4-mannosyl-glycoprotein beta-1,4-N-acetylglucosaminyltransferase
VINELLLCNDWVTVIVVEANKTHTGWDKPLYFERDKHYFEKYKNLMYYLVEDMPNGTPREREAHQRNAIMKALRFNEPKDDDIVIIADVDEIPRAKAVNMFKPDMEFASLSMEKYAYFLNCIEDGAEWDRCRIMSWGYLKNKKPEDVRNSGFDIVILKGGWHYSWCIDPLRKLESFSHVELDTPPNIERVQKKENIWSDNQLKMIDINLSHAEYLFKNQDKFAHLISKEL